jgi:hypothetical protein
MTCEQTSIGMPPLDSGPGLYGNGQNLPPHLARGIAAAGEVVSRLMDGTPAERGGKVVVAGVGGMSNSFQIFDKMIYLYRQVYGRGRRLTFANLNKATFDARRIAVTDPALYWDGEGGVMQKLAKRNISPLQVQVLWIYNVVRLQTKPFPADADELEVYLEIILNESLRRFPNTKQIFLSSSNYFGYALPGAPSSEPHAWGEAYGVQSLILNRVNDESLPYIAWGPYFWADGLIPRPSDGLIWKCEDYVEKDRVHPSESGKLKLGRMLLNFFETNQATRWFNP